MLKVDTKNLVKKLEQLKEQLPQVVEKSLLDIGERIKYDIISMNARLYSPTWKAATRYYDNQPYFSRTGAGAGTGPGIVDAVAKTNINIVSSDKMKVILGIGSKSQMDADTRMSNGGSYWELFEYGTLGQRSGADPENNFIPAGGFGKRGQGFTENNKSSSSSAYLSEGDVQEIQNATGHPGVLPVRIFGDTVDHYEKLVKWQIKRDIQEFLKKI